MDWNVVGAVATIVGVIVAIVVAVTQGVVWLADRSRTDRPGFSMLSLDSYVLFFYEVIRSPRAVRLRLKLAPPEVFEVTTEDRQLRPSSKVTVDTFRLLLKRTSRWGRRGQIVKQARKSFVLIGYKVEEIEIATSCIIARLASGLGFSVYLCFPLSAKKALYYFHREDCHFSGEAELLATVVTMTPDELYFYKPNPTLVRNYEL